MKLRSPRTSLNKRFFSASTRRTFQFIVFNHSYLCHVRARVKNSLDWGPCSILPFSWLLSHVITLLLTFTAVKHVSSPNHNKDNRGSTCRYIPLQVDITVCAG
ncbi:hypothetical protein AMECASPLE_028222 [Ameca splendens]|uniref:Uncharacterized protein n=1 Tax=Ameca splendens TaxID=208324 RepID=A0ABV0YTZ9_9TELE